MVKVFKFNKNNKIEFTQDELEKLLNEAYNAGYYDGKYSHNYWTWTSPYYTGTPSWYGTTYTTTTASNASDECTITCGANNPTSDTVCINSSDYKYGDGTVTIKVSKD